MDEVLYIKVFENSMSESQVIFEGNVFNKAVSKNNFYLYFSNESSDKIYKLHYNWNITISYAS